MFLKKFLAGILFAAMIILPATTFAAPSVAVIPFANQSARQGVVPEGDIMNIRNYVEEEIVYTKKFNPLPRQDLEKLLDEIKFQQSGLVDPTTAAKLGRWVGAEYLVIGNITGLGKKDSKYVANLSLRMIKVETAEIYLAGRGTGQAKNAADALQKAAEDALTGKRGMLTLMHGGK